MAKAKTKTPPESSRKSRPAIDPYAREQQLIAKAVDCAELQLSDGSASSQVIVHYLKMGSERYRLENERLREENKLLRAKTEELQSNKRSEELIEEALKAFRNYAGHGDPDEYQDV